MFLQQVTGEIPNPSASSAQVRFVRRNAITSTARASRGQQPPPRPQPLVPPGQ
jgi:hypothetical protein